jgi:hypothetical protein
VIAAATKMNQKAVTALKVTNGQDVITNTTAQVNAAAQCGARLRADSSCIVPPIRLVDAVLG